jgi:hypothetical protein
VKVSESELSKWRTAEACAVVVNLADHARKDITFVPTKANSTERWHCRAGSIEYELLLSGPKFYDTRARKGGGGAVDLVMHLFKLDFKAASQKLRAANL